MPKAIKRIRENDKHFNIQKWVKKPLSNILLQFDSGVWGNESKENSVPILRSNNIQDNTFIFDKDLAFRDIQKGKIEKYRLRYGDIVVVKSSGSKSHIGKCAIYEKKDDSCFLFSNFTQRLTTNSHLVLPHYLYYYLISPIARHELQKMNATSSGLRNIQPRIYIQQEIPLPSIPVQEQIVQILQKADEIRRKRKEALLLADQILPSLFLEIFGDPSTNKNQWPKVPIGRVVHFDTAHIKPEAGTIYNYIAPEHIESHSGNYTGPHPIDGRDLRSSKHPFTKEHVLYCKLRPYLNKVILPENEGICSTELIPLRPGPKLLREFLAIYLRLPFFVSQAVQKSQGTKMPRFGPDLLKQEEMIIPPIPVQKSFCAQVNQLLGSSQRLKEGLNIAGNLFDSLLSRAFTGELTAEWEEANADWINTQIELQKRLPRLLLLALIRENATRTEKGSQTAVLITALMKYTFLLQMEGNSRRRFYQFIPYHYGPFAKELYTDLERLKADGLISIDKDTNEDKIRINLTYPDQADKALSEIPDDLKEDVIAILDTYGELDHKTLLNTVYEKYSAYAKKSQLRGRNG